ncbi:hypothetical protein AVEN_57160-1 [Araneus ventricosus]|uniref:Uncharacterized protein n=1 Tax=Araneus ventricosus TaxID=182803 RepID=A0A4Y2HFV7_ARAVE|nr:hypothetical protein AVEN_57160-1 [Araneus ventricosus]
MSNDSSTTSPNITHTVTFVIRNKIKQFTMCSFCVSKPMKTESSRWFPKIIDLAVGCTLSTQERSRYASLNFRLIHCNPASKGITAMTDFEWRQHPSVGPKIFERQRCLHWARHFPFANVWNN